MVSSPVDPRVRRTCARVLDHAGRLLVDEGAQAVTFDRISRDIGVSRTTLYRHWARPADLLIEAYRRLTEPPPATPTDDLPHDLQRLLIGARDGLTTGVWTRALPSLVLAAEHDPELAAVHARFTELRREPMLERLRLAVTRGELPSGTDAEWLCDALAAPLFYRRYQRRVPTPDGYVEEHVRRCLTAAGQDVPATAQRRPTADPKSS
jgi:AcrR family transcriptional regulator